MSDTRSSVKATIVRPLSHIFCTAPIRAEDHGEIQVEGNADRNGEHDQLFQISEQHDKGKCKGNHQDDLLPAGGQGQVRVSHYQGTQKYANQ